MIMREEQISASADAHAAGDRDMEINGGLGVLRSMPTTFAVDLMAGSIQKFYATTTIQPFGVAPSEIRRYFPTGFTDQNFRAIDLPLLDEARQGVIDIQGLIFSRNRGGVETVTGVGVARAVVTGEGSGVYYYPAAVRVVDYWEKDPVIDPIFGKNGGMMYVFRKPVDGPLPDQDLGWPHLPSSPFSTYVSTVRDDAHVLFCCGLLKIDSGKYTYVLVKIKHTGEPCEGFGDNGVQIISAASDQDALQWNDYAMQADGGITLVGVTAAQDAGVVMRYTSEGASDSSYGEAGKIIIRAEPFACQLTHVCVSVTGEATVLTLVSAPEPYAAVIRLLNNGEADKTFNEGAPFKVTSLTANKPCLAVDSKGRVIVAGESAMTPQVACAVRITPSGILDDEFGEGGSKEYSTLKPFQKVVIISGADILATTDDPAIPGFREIAKLFGEASEDPSS